MQCEEQGAAPAARRRRRPRPLGRIPARAAVAARARPSRAAARRRAVCCGMQRQVQHMNGAAAGPWYAQASRHRLNMARPCSQRHVHARVRRARNAPGWRALAAGDAGSRNIEIVIHCTNRGAARCEQKQRAETSMQGIASRLATIRMPPCPVPRLSCAVLPASQGQERAAARRPGVCAPSSAYLTVCAPGPNSGRCGKRRAENTYDPALPDRSARLVQCEDETASVFVYGGRTGLTTRRRTT